MPKNEVEKVTDEKLNRGGVLAKLYFDMQDKEKAKLQPVMVDLVNERLLKEPGVVYCFGSIDEPIERAGIFVTNAVLTILVENFFSLVRIAFNYAPAGIEIMKPTKDMTFKTYELQSMLMDLSQLSVMYSKYIIEKVMSPEDLEKMRRSMENRAEIGKKYLEKKDDKAEKTS